MLTIFKNIKKYILGLLVIIGLPFSANAQTQTENYILTKTYKVESTAPFNSDDPFKVVKNIQYFDGIGRIKQSILLKGGAINKLSPYAKDIVTHHEYDGFGRQARKYLPYAASNTSGQLASNAVDNTLAYYFDRYGSDFPNIQDPLLTNAFSESFYENESNRVIEQTAPGLVWDRSESLVNGKNYSTGHTLRSEFEFNKSNEVKYFEVSLSLSNSTYFPSIEPSGYYQDNVLTKTITKTENWTVSDGKNETIEEFKNKKGQVVLKRNYNNNSPHDTYYVYDHYDNLSYVIPPKAADQELTSEVLNQLCYQYVYDKRNRLVEKKIPGKGWEYMVYNKLDKVILTQDANQRNLKEWLFTKYDALGRIAYTGNIIDNSSRENIQSLANQEDSGPLFEQRGSSADISGTKIYYTNKTIPEQVHHAHLINYYDTYIDLPLDFIAPKMVYGQEVTDNTKGLTTVTKARVLNTNHWITTITYYDKKARPIYIYSQNEYLQTTDIVEKKLDFTGKEVKTKTTHKRRGKVDLITVDSFEYDQMDRLVNHSQKVDNVISQRIVRNQYDDLGKLIGKLIGNGTKSGYTDVNSGIQISKDVITRVSGSGWNAGLATSGSIEADGYLEFSANKNPSHMMIGVSDRNINDHHNTIDYAIYIAGTAYRIYENGIYRGQFGKYSEGDVFQIERIGNKIHYKREGKIFYTSIKPSSGTLIGDVSIYTNGGKIKNLHIVDNSKGLQNVDYNHNIRGWLKNINQDSQNDNDLFNFTLRYNNPTSGAALYNGNISQTSWNTLNQDSSNKTYTYQYDALNRITSAIDNTEKYSLESVSYDKNGNILNLKRIGHVNAEATKFGLMDDLHYSYGTGNTLELVNDKGNKTYGFKDISGNDYTYDVNGNLTKDLNKGIHNIKYNHLNLPEYVEFSEDRYIQYVYDATGVKQRKIVSESEAKKNVTDYANGYSYKNNELQFFNNSEGYTQSQIEGAKTLMSDYFDMSTNSWEQAGSAILSSENARLKVKASGRYHGAQKYFKGVSYNDKIGYNITLDKGNTQRLMLVFFEHDAYGTKLRTRVVDPYADGYYHGYYTVSDTRTSMIRVKVEKGYASDINTFTEFFIDNAVFVKMPEMEDDFYSYNYQYKDHLDNVRLTYSDVDKDGYINADKEILSENNYYPFGLKHKGYNNYHSPNENTLAKNWGYTGKEHQEEFGIEWIDITARNYDASLARWMNIDPLAEQMRRHSPYNYAFNNPIYFMDPDGMKPIVASGHNDEDQGSDPDPNPIIRFFKSLLSSVTKVRASSGDDAEADSRLANKMKVADTMKKTIKTMKAIDDRVSFSGGGDFEASHEGSGIGVEYSRYYSFNLLDGLQIDGNGFSLSKEYSEEIPISYSFDDNGDFSLGFSTNTKRAGGSISFGSNGGDFKISQSGRYGIFQLSDETVFNRSGIKSQTKSLGIGFKEEKKLGGFTLSASIGAQVNVNTILEKK